MITHHMLVHKMIAIAIILAFIGAWQIGFHGLWLKT